MVHGRDSFEIVQVCHGLLLLNRQQQLVDDFCRATRRNNNITGKRRRCTFVHQFNVIAPRSSLNLTRMKRLAVIPFERR